MKDWQPIETAPKDGTNVLLSIARVAQSCHGEGMAEVTALRNGESLVGINEPVEDVVKMLEELLADARAGNVRQCAYAAIMKDTDYETGVAGDGRILILLGAVSCLEHRIVNAHRTIEGRA